MTHTPQEYDAKRAEVVNVLADGMKTMSDGDIATRIVSMLIHDKGNLNKYDATLTIALEAHRKAVLRDAAKVIQDNQILHGGERGRELSPRIDGNIEGMHYATEILKLAGDVQ